MKASKYRWLDSNLARVMNVGLFGSSPLKRPSATTWAEKSASVSKVSMKRLAMASVGSVLSLLMSLSVVHHVSASVDGRSESLPDRVGDHVAAIVIRNLDMAQAVNIIQDDAENRTAGIAAIHNLDTAFDVVITIPE